MILHGVGTSSSRIAATTQAAGSDFNLQANRSLASAMTGAAADNEARRSAAEQMRYQLYLLDRSQRRPSIEDCVAALLESAGEAAEA
jgi:hypothetical protein